MSNFVDRCLYRSFSPEPVSRQIAAHPQEGSGPSKHDDWQLDAPIPLTIRKRRLTLPLEPLSASPRLGRSQITKNQFQSRLFKLPPEIRQNIYYEVLADQLFHVVKKVRRLGFIRCGKTMRPLLYLEDLPGHHDDDQCWGIIDKCGKLQREWSWSIGQISKSGYTHGGLLPLLLTCRLVYTEAINIVYAHNCFSFNRIDTLLFFKISILPYRLNNIRYIQLSWYFFKTTDIFSASSIRRPPHDYATWAQTWQVIAAMEGLQKIHLELDALWRFLEKPVEDKLLAPLNLAKQVERFEVSIYWLSKDYANPGERTIDDNVIPRRGRVNGGKIEWNISKTQL